MQRHASQRGAALILLLGITATLAILSATLVFVIENQQSATASDRASKQSFYASEAALDSAVQVAKIDKTMSTTAEWLMPADLAAAFAGVFPTGATVTYRVYDNLATVNYNIKWGQNLDNMVWVEATVTYQGKTTRTRVLVKQSREPFAAALPKAVTYSDTGIMLNDRSNIYAVNADGSPDTSGPPYQTSITAGGTSIPSMPSSWAEVGRFTTNSSTTLAASGTSTQSLGITANGSVRMAGAVFNSAPSRSIIAGGRTFDEVVIQPGTSVFSATTSTRRPRRVSPTSHRRPTRRGRTPAARLWPTLSSRDRGLPITSCRSRASPSTQRARRTRSRTISS